MKFVSIIAVSLLLALVGACGGGAGGTQLTIKTAGKEMPFTVKSSMSDFGNIISTAPNKPPIQTFSHTIYLANFEMDTTNVATMKKPVVADQVRVVIGLQGEEGTKDESPFKVGTYSIKSERFNKVRTVMISTFSDGKEKTESFDTMSSMSKAEGEVKITAVTADSVSGEISLTEGEKSIKGTFTAKLPKK